MNVEALTKVDECTYEIFQFIFDSLKCQLKCEYYCSYIENEGDFSKPFHSQICHTNTKKK